MELFLQRKITGLEGAVNRLYILRLEEWGLCMGDETKYLVNSKLYYRIAPNRHIFKIEL